MKEKTKWDAPDNDESIRVLSKEGFDGVEWMLGYHFNSPEELERLVEKTRKCSLEVSNIMCWQDLLTEDESARNAKVKSLEEFISCAGMLSIPVLNVFTGPITWSTNCLKVGRDISEGRAWSVVFDAFSRIVESAERNNVIVTVEAVFGMLVHDYYTMREFLGYFESNNLGVTLDPSHLTLYGNDPAWAASRLSHRIKHVHVKDAVGKAGTLGEDFVFPFLGEGGVDWLAFFSALKNVNYRGYLSLEFENDTYLKNVCDGDWRVAVTESKSRLMKFLKQSNFLRNSI
jgi:sugar phosphate isomerase/epimerase